MEEYNLMPGYEDFCEDCKFRYMLADENGISYQCDDSEECEMYREAIIEFNS